MDGIDGLLGWGIGIWAIIGVALLFLGYYGQSLGFVGAQPRKILKVLGWIVIIGVVLSYLGLFASSTTTTTESEAIFEVGVSESMSHVTYDSTTHKFAMACTFNDTDDAFESATEYLEANFTITRADVNLEDAIATGALVSVGLVHVTGASNEYIMDENSDGTYSFQWTKSGSISTYEDSTVKVESGDSGWVVLNITLNADAMAEMAQYEISTITFTLAEIAFEIDVMKATVNP
jgi:hypothetical protein